MNGTLIAVQVSILHLQIYACVPNLIVRLLRIVADSGGHAETEAVPENVWSGAIHAKLEMLSWEHEVLDPCYIRNRSGRFSNRAQSGCCSSFFWRWVSRTSIWLYGCPA